MVHSKRRVSYVVPLPLEPVPRLQLPPFGVPRLGSTGPLLIPSHWPTVVHDYEEDPSRRIAARRPRHRLGVASLALDTSTQLSGRNAPEGILYTGGRDGQVISWDLGVAMKKKDMSPKTGGDHLPVGRWEVMTGWADDYIDEEAEENEERMGSDGDVLGDVVPSGGRRRRPSKSSSQVLRDDQWETDLEAFRPGQPGQFRQCAQAHTDWVNDLLLCNHNQTVVSASSDGTIKAWNPHSNMPSDPSTIGSHADYVRCLAHSPEQNWIASGSFDRSIKLWDLNKSVGQSSPTPLMTLSPPDASTAKASIYALAADPFGHTIASGSPERVIRLWDPRSGKRSGKLVGHMDNIRAILISEDSRYLLTGSTDASIKLWSLSSKRCLHTFMYHTDSVWSLFSSHPSLEIFYSGDKSGLVCRVDVEDCADVSEGECVLLCQDPGTRSKAASDGINRIAVMDDNLLWTASSSSSVSRWQIPQRRSVRVFAPPFDGELERLMLLDSPLTSLSRRLPPTAPEVTSTRPRSVHESITRPPTSASVDLVSPVSPHGREDESALHGIPYPSLIRLSSPHDPFTPYTFSKSREADVATLYSAASIMSVPRPSVSRPPNPFQPPQSHPSRGLRMEDAMPLLKSVRGEYEERELAWEAVPLCSAPDDVIEGEHGLVRSVMLNDRIHALTVDTAGEVAVWDIVRAVCRGKYTPEEVASASHRESTFTGNDGELETSPREALEAVRERIEGEAVVVPWCSVDTKTGVLTIHLNERCFEAELYADEVGFSHDRFGDETRLNIAKWALRNIFLGFIREQQRSRRRRDPNGSEGNSSSSRRDDASGAVEPIVRQPKKQSSSSSDLSRYSTPLPSSSSLVISSPKMVPAVVLPGVQLSTPASNSHRLRKATLTPLSTIAPKDDTTPHTRSRSQNTDGVPQSAPMLTSSAALRDGDYFSHQPRPPIPGNVPASAPTTQAGTLSTTDDVATPKTDAGLSPNPTTPGGGIMGRLKSFGGKISSTKRSSDAGPSSASQGGGSAPDVPAVPEGLAIPATPVAKTPQQILLSGPLSFPPSTEAPTHPLPPNVYVIISEEAYPGWTTIYRGMVASAAHDARILEEVLPMWLLEYLLLNRAPPASVPKLSFVLLPWPSKDPDVETLPELLDVTQSKLTASRFLRIRKVIVHVHEKLDKISRSSTPRSSSSLELSPNNRANRSRSEDFYEILCNDVVLPLDITLAAVRQFVWRQSGELIMYYRQRVVMV